MKVAFFSNFLNHHQLPFCQEMITLLGSNNFVFVANGSSNPNCIALGYDEMNYKFPFVLRAYESEKEQARAIEIAKTYDVAIIGAFSDAFLKERMKKNLLTFVFTERFFRDYGKNRGLGYEFRTGLEVFRKYTIYRSKPLYFLCAGAYVHQDLKRCGFPVKKCFKWGYFPEAMHYGEDFLRAKEKSGLNHPCVSILCAGRLIGWKHPELAVSVANELKLCGVNFKLTYVGEGELRNKLQQSVSEYGLEQLVQFTGPLPYSEVRRYMIQNQIFLFTSDHNEGWGAVLNEAMNSACAVVACDKIGSAPFLVRDGENGFLFDGTSEDLFRKVQFLSNNPILRGQLGHNASLTIANTWNATHAARSFLHLVNNITNGKPVDIYDGPCSSVEKR